MSELSLDNIIPETQEDEECSVTKNNDNKNEEDLSLNESQDFRLVAEDETQNDETIGDNDLIKATENNEHEADAKAVGEEARDSDKDKTTVEQQTKANVDEGESNIDNNADEIIESSQVESSPKHKQLVAGTQKRKATGDSDAEPSLKIPRTSSREDALDAGREKLESATDEKKNEETSEEAKPPASDEPDSKSAQVDDEKVDESSTEVAAEVATDEKMEVDEEVPAEKPAESTESPSKSSEAPSKLSESPSKTSEAPAKSSESPSKSVEPSSTSANLPETSTNSSETAKAVENPSELSKSCAIEDEKMEVDSATTKESTKSSKVIDQTSKKSRMSIEVIYDKALAPPPKPKELVEIDEDGEKIVLDSSQETSFKSPESKSAVDNPLTNGSGSKSKKPNETLGNTPATAETSIDSKTIPTTECINVVSDSENDSSVIEKPKIISIEKEMNVLVKIKCLLQFNETTKEISEKEFLTVDFDNLPDLNISRRRNSDISGLADVSDNKDTLSPGSVTSNAQPYTLNPRFSVLSTVSAGSSSSSGSSIVAGGHSASNFPGGSSKLVKDALFSLPRGVPKHAKRMPENLEEVAEKVKKEWKNPNLLTYGILAFVNSEISAADLHNGINEQDTLERLTASTPEAQKKIIATPKSSKKGRVAKRSRPNQRSSRTNGIAKIAQEASIFNDSDPAIIAAEVSTPPRQSSRTLSILRNQTPVDDPSDELIGKICFAKWSDNNYYPGKIVNKSKGKYKVTFMDGKSKMLIQDFILPWDDPPSGLSVFALTKEGYGSPGIITGTKKVKSETVYIVETDEDGKMEVPIKRIFMSSDQAQSLKELDAEKFRNKPSSSEVTMDNIVEGSRASVPTALTTSTKRTLSSNKFARSSSSGLAEKKETSDNVSSLPDVDTNLQGVQPELIDTPNDFAPKGPASRVKGKGKNRKKSEDTELINTLGPIPKSGSTLFKGMNFILTCAPLESLDRYKMEKRDSLGSEPETENETEWNSIPFVRERLTAQITAGGGQVYNDFEAIPVDEYKNTKLITNVPNITAKSLLCLSAGIYPVNHRWIIRSCQENKLVNISEEILPTGWSFIKEAYVDTYQRKNSKPLTHAIIALPDKPERSSEFWQQVITNAGGVVRVFSSPPQRFDNVTVVMPLEQEPSTAVIREAKRLDLPLVSTTWLVQSLIEGRMMPCDAHPIYAHNSEKK